MIQTITELFGIGMNEGIAVVAVTLTDAVSVTVFVSGARVTRPISGIAHLTRIFAGHPFTEVDRPTTTIDAFLTWGTGERFTGIRPRICCLVRIGRAAVETGWLRASCIVGPARYRARRTGDRQDGAE